jgi:hypothetical protein
VVDAEEQPHKEECESQRRSFGEHVPQLIYHVSGPMMSNWEMSAGLPQAYTGEDLVLHGPPIGE